MPPTPVNMHFMFCVPPTATPSRLLTCEVNVIHNYMYMGLSYLDWAQAAGLWVLYDLKPLIHDRLDDTQDPTEQWTIWNNSKAEVATWINEVKNHPALYGYYVTDEPNLEGRLIPLDLQQAIYDYVKSIDPDHYVAFAIVCKDFDLVKFSACDFLIPDNYAHDEIHYACQQLRLYLDDHPEITEPPLVFTVCACNAPGNPVWRGNIRNYLDRVDQYNVGTGGYGMYAWQYDGEDCESNDDVLNEVKDAWGVNVWPTPEGNQSPTAPTGLFCEGIYAPFNITDLTPEFSAIYNDPDIGDQAKGYLLYVATSIVALEYPPDMWNSGFVNIESQNLLQGQRCQDIVYAGIPLSLNGQTFYWKILFEDINGAIGGWSEPAQFKMSSGDGGILILKRSDMLKEVYDQNIDNVIDNAKKIDGLTVGQVRDHTPKAHTHPEYGGFPAPSYDSGWHVTQHQVIKTFTHNLGTRDLVIQAYFKIGSGSWNPIECTDPKKAVVWFNDNNSLSFYNLSGGDGDARVLLWKW